MLYAVLCLDKDGKSELRAATRPVHLEYLEKYRSRIAISGPLLKEDQMTPKGSLLILDFADYAEAREFADNDPYAQAGLFDSVSITPFRKVF